MTVRLDLSLSHLKREHALGRQNGSLRLQTAHLVRFRSFKQLKSLIKMSPGCRFIDLVKYMCGAYDMQCIEKKIRKDCFVNIIRKSSSSLWLYSIHTYKYALSCIVITKTKLNKIMCYM